MFVVLLMGARADNDPSERTRLSFVEAERDFYKRRQAELPLAKFKAREQRLVKRVENYPPLTFLNEPVMLDLCRTFVKLRCYRGQSFQKIIASRSVFGILAQLRRKPIWHDFAATPEGEKVGSGIAPHLPKK